MSFSRKTSPTTSNLQQYRFSTTTSNPRNNLIQTVKVLLLLLLLLLHWTIICFWVNFPRKNASLRRQKRHPTRQKNPDSIRLVYRTSSTRAKKKKRLPSSFHPSSPPAIFYRLFSTGYFLPASFYRLLVTDRRYSTSSMMNGAISSFWPCL